MTPSATNRGEEWLLPPGEHPPKADLIAYRDDRLEAAEGEKIRAHITTCILCRGLFLNLGRVPASSARSAALGRSGSRRPKVRGSARAPARPILKSKAKMAWKRTTVSRHMYDSFSGMLDPLG